VEALGIILMEQDIDTIGQRIKHLREAKSMSQYKLGQLIGSSDTYIAQVESGLVKAPGGEKLVKFAEALETTTDYLLTGKILKIEEITKESQALADLSNIKETITEIEERLRTSRPQTVRLPDYGPAPAGTPLDISQAPPGYMDIPIEYANGIAANKLFIVHASGESLVEDDIHDGDILIVERNPELIEGKIYVVNIPGNGITVKHLYRTTDNKARLVPANHNIPEMVFEEVKVEGRVLASFRPPIKH
jgi:SOS-response transcriptional repressor LexA